MKEADEEGYLDEGSDGISLNEEHKGVAAAVEAIDAVVESLDEPPDDFEKWYSDNTDQSPTSQGGHSGRSTSSTGSGSLDGFFSYLHR